MPWPVLDCEVKKSLGGIFFLDEASGRSQRVPFVTSFGSFGFKGRLQGQGFLGGLNIFFCVLWSAASNCSETTCVVWSSPDAASIPETHHDETKPQGARIRYDTLRQ